MLVYYYLALLNACFKLCIHIPLGAVTSCSFYKTGFFIFDLRTGQELLKDIRSLIVIVYHISIVFFFQLNLYMLDIFNIGRYNEYCIMYVPELISFYTLFMNQDLS